MANDGRYKIAVEEKGLLDFDIANGSNSRSDLLGRLHTEEKRVEEEVWEIVLWYVGNYGL